jgi:hypothetical protein
MQSIRRSKNRSDHETIRGAAGGMFHAMRVDQMEQLLRSHGLRFGRSSILRVVRWELATPCSPRERLVSGAESRRFAGPPTE